jgi:lipocalin-like protein
MKRFLLTCVACTILTASARSLDPKEKKLIGTWMLTGYVLQRANGDVQYPFGSAPTGTLSYRGDRTMDAQIMGTARPKITRLEATDSEKATENDSYIAYFGTFDVDTQKHIVTHHVVGSLDTGRIGMDQVRHYKLEGDRLTLVTTSEVLGEHYVYIISWRRAR